jgi:MFS family permease
MFSAFLLEGLAIWVWLQTINRPVMFVLLSSAVFFAWGEIFSLFPSITADLFGRKWATTNYGLVYTSKGTASIFAAPVAAYVMAKTGSWVPVFYVMIVCDIAAALLALFALKPLAKRTIEQVGLRGEQAEAKTKLATV